MSQVNIIMIEDDPIIRESLIDLFRAQVAFNVVTSFQNVEPFLESNPFDELNILLLDIELKGGMTGLEGIRHIKTKYPKVDIIMLTTFDDSDKIFKALCAGASAYITKRTPFQKLIDAIYTVYRGGSYMSPSIARKVVDYFSPKQNIKVELTARQLQIVECIVEGMSYKMVADRLMISIETVRDHIKNIYRKLNINSKAELIRKKLDGEI